MRVRTAAALPAAQPPNLGRPITVDDLGQEHESYWLSLDEAIRVALQNAEVIRIVQGTSASSTGRTIYDPAITNTQIDAARGQFDPSLDASSIYNRTESPQGVLDPTAPAGASIIASDVRQAAVSAGISKQHAGGGTMSVTTQISPTDINPGSQLALDPQTSSSLDLSFTQPLLRGFGVDVNQAPIVIAKINTERSYFQLKNSVQQMVQSVIASYWQLVSARVQLWATEQQVKQLEFAYKLFDAQRQVGRGDIGDTSQAQVSLAQFRANLVSIRADVLDREAALFNALGIPPRPNVRLIPTSTPDRNKFTPDWDALLAEASTNRPDLIELKLTIESDEQQLRVSTNSTLPQLDAVGQYRTNGLRGTTPNGSDIENDFFQFNDIQFGLNLRTPVGQRSTRAQMRQDQLTLARDRALYHQQLHSVTHLLAANLRNLDNFFAQYRAFQKVREASRVNINRQLHLFEVGGTAAERPIYLNVLQAISDWGNSISSEAASLAAYNASLANLQLESGTILERHGIFFEERFYSSLAPFGRRRSIVMARYPQELAPGSNEPRYDDGKRPAEQSFDLKSPAENSPFLRRDRSTQSNNQSNGEAADQSEAGNSTTQEIESIEKTIDTWIDKSLHDSKDDAKRLHSPSLDPSRRGSQPARDDPHSPSPKSPFPSPAELLERAPLSSELQETIEDLVNPGRQEKRG